MSASASVPASVQASGLVFERTYCKTGLCICFQHQHRFQQQLQHQTQHSLQLQYRRQQFHIEHQPLLHRKVKTCSNVIAEDGADDAHDAATLGSATMVSGEDVYARQRPTTKACLTTYTCRRTWKPSVGKRRVTILFETIRV